VTLADYKTLQLRHLDHLVSRLPAHLERVEWTAEQLAAWRTARLRDMVAAAQQRSRWHRERLSGVDAATIDESSLVTLPVMTKSDLMSCFDDIVTDQRVTLDLVNAHVAGLTTDAYLFDEYHAVASGGSSGVRGVFVWGWDAWAEAYLAVLRRNWFDRLRVPDPPGHSVVTMLVAADRAAHFTSAAAQNFTMPEVEAHRFPVNLSVDNIVAGLNRVNGDSLVAYASMLGLLVAEARAGRLTISPSRVVSTSEPLLPEVRAGVQDVWGAPVANLWGTSEGGVTAMGCWQADGMHVSDDLVIVEPVDDDGNPVPAGTRSAKVFLTNLFNPLLPLIRYEITDQMTVLDEPCPCGSAHRRIADIEGRLDDVFIYENNIVVHPHVFRSTLGHDSETVEYQVRQTTRGAQIAVVGTLSTNTTDLAQALASDLRRLGVADPQVTVTRTDVLERHPDTGKLRRFIPQVAPGD